MVFNKKSKKSIKDKELILTIYHFLKNLLLFKTIIYIINYFYTLFKYRNYCFRMFILFLNNNKSKSDDDFFYKYPISKVLLKYLYFILFFYLFIKYFFRYVLVF